MTRWQLADHFHVWTFAQIGFNRDGVRLFTVRPSTFRYKGPELTRVFEDLSARPPE